VFVRGSAKSRTFFESELKESQPQDPGAKPAPGAPGTRQNDSEMSRLSSGFLSGCGECGFLVIECPSELFKQPRSALAHKSVYEDPVV
jgi:hypothetical protein